MLKTPVQWSFSLFTFSCNFKSIFRVISTKNFLKSISLVGAFGQAKNFFLNFLHENGKVPSNIWPDTN